MIEFKSLLIPPHNRGIYINCEVLDMSYFKDVYIDKIEIDTQKTFDTSGVSKKTIYKKIIEGNQKKLEIFIDETELLDTITGNMFFVYITTKGTPASDTPCGLDEKVTLGVCADLYNIYREGIIYLRDIYYGELIPKAFIDFILKNKAFEMALKTRDFLLAIEYWESLQNDLTILNDNT